MTLVYIYIACFANEFLITLGILEHYINCRIHIDCMTLVYIYIACFANEFLITLGIFRTLYKL